MPVAIALERRVIYRQDEQRLGANSISTRESGRQPPAKISVDDSCDDWGCHIYSLLTRVNRMGD